ncbi:hypothetical protein D3C87_1211740 [compost metagenome]
METVLVRVIGTELGRLLDHLAIPEFAGDRPRRIALPVTAGLDAEQVVAAAAILRAHDRLAPSGFQCGLGHQVARIDANAIGRFLGHGQHGVDEFVGGTEGFLRRSQRNLCDGATMNLQGTARRRLRIRQPVAVVQRPGTAGCYALRQLSLADRRRCRRGGRHQACQQAIGQFRWQCQAPLIDQRHVIVMRALACRRLDRTRSPQRTLAIDPRQRPVDRHRARRDWCLRSGFRGLLLGGGQRCRFTRRQRFVLRHLAHQHVGQTNTTTLAGHGNGQLLVVHFLVLLGFSGVERIVLAQRFGGRAHGLEHFAKEQRFEFLRHLAHVRVAVLVADLELIQPVQVGERTRIAAADPTTLEHVHMIAALRSRSGRLARRRPVSVLRGWPSSHPAPRRPGSPHGRFRRGWCPGRI